MLGGGIGCGKKKRITGHEGTLVGDSFVYFLNYGDSFIGVYTYQNIKLYILNMCRLLSI